MDTDLYNILLTVAAGFLVVAFLITTWRIVIGPNSLDRLIALIRENGDWQEPE